jgi:hypothetical protein
VLLAVAAGLFAAWIGYLAFLALTTSHPVVLSRPQFLVADFWVTARVDDLNGPVQVGEVMYVREEKKDQAPAEAATIDVRNLSDCKRAWTGPGQYILPLVRRGGSYAVSAIPRSPGYEPLDLRHKGDEYRIYPDTPRTRAEVGRLPRP